MKELNCNLNPLNLKVMKKFILTLFVVAVGYTATAQNKAKIEFKTDEIDYGDIAKGSDGLKVFEFTNTGDAPLVISKVNSSCGCTVPSWTKDPVMPGKTGKIEVKYNTNTVGPIRKTITVESNAETPMVALKIKGNVLAADGSQSVMLKGKSN